MNIGEPGVLMNRVLVYLILIIASASPCFAFSPIMLTPSEPVVPLLNNAEYLVDSDGILTRRKLSSGGRCQLN